VEKHGETEEHFGELGENNELNGRGIKFRKYGEIFIGFFKDGR
jgi:hypothetical protein